MVAAAVGSGQAEKFVLLGLVGPGGGDAILGFRGTVEIATGRRSVLPPETARRSQPSWRCWVTCQQPQSSNGQSISLGKPEPPFRARRHAARPLPLFPPSPRGLYRRERDRWGDGQKSCPFCPGWGINSGGDWQRRTGSIEF